MCGCRLRQLRRARHLTQQQLAWQAGISVQDVSALARTRRTNPMLRVIEALARALDVTPDALMDALWPDPG